MNEQIVKGKVKMTVDTAEYKFPWRWYDNLRPKRINQWKKARNRLIKKNRKLGNNTFEVDEKKKTIIFEIGE